MTQVDINQVRAVIEFALPVCLYVPDNKYSCQMPSYTAVLQIKRRKHKHIDERLFIESAESVQLKRDRHGRLIYTELNVTIPARAVFDSNVSVVDSQIFARADNNLPRTALKLAIEVANRFIDVYRDVDDGAFYIRQISEGDIYKTTVDWFLDERHLGGDLIVMYGRGMTLEPISLLPEAMEKLETELATYTPMALTKKLFMSTQDYFDLEDYRMVVIEARTCIEVAVDQLLLTVYRDRGEDLERLRKLLEVGKKYANSIESILQHAEINLKLTKGLNRAIGISLDSIEHNWLKWLAAKDSRERAVHRAAEITGAEGNNALQVLKHILELTQT